jgi:hypothetical protein
MELVVFLFVVVVTVVVVAMGTSDEPLGGPGAVLKFAGLISKELDRQEATGGQESFRTAQPLLGVRSLSFGRQQLIPLARRNESALEIPSGVLLVSKLPCSVVDRREPRMLSQEDSVTLTGNRRRLAIWRRSDGLPGRVEN